MTDNNETIKSASRENQDADPDVIKQNQNEMAAYETYMIAKDDLGKLEAKQDQLSRDEKTALEVLRTYVSNFEKTREETLKALAEANAIVMESA